MCQIIQRIPPASLTKAGDLVDSIILFIYLDMCNIYRSLNGIWPIRMYVQICFHLVLYSAIKPIRFIYDTNTTHEVMVCGVPFPCQKGKSQGHNSPLKYFRCPLYGSVPASPICFICGTNTSHEGTMYHAPFSSQQSKFNALQTARAFAMGSC